VSKQVRLYNGRVLHDVPWQSLSVERASALGFRQGQYVQMTTPGGEEFMLAFGVGRAGWVTVLINVDGAYAKAYSMEGDARHVAEEIAVLLLDHTCAQAAANVGLDDVHT